MRESFKNCRTCGRLIGVIDCGFLRKVVVDGYAVMVKADPAGQIYVDINGRKMRGREIGIEEAEEGGAEVCAAYRPHRCGGTR